MTRVNDTRFSFNGRGGVILFDDGARRAKLGWEMLVGDGPTIMVFGEQCAWTFPDTRSMSRDEIRDLVQAFAKAVPTSITIQFVDGREDVAP